MCHMRRIIVDLNSVMIILLFIAFNKYLSIEGKVIFLEGTNVIVD